MFLAVLLLLQPAWAQPVFEPLAVPALGGVANAGSSGGASSTPDGRLVVFASSASNLIVGDTNGADDIFLRDRVLGFTMRVSVGSMRWDGEQDQANGRSFSPVISADGRFVAFVSEASDLVPGDSNGAADVFVHDRSTGGTSRVSVSSTAAEGDFASTWPSISADGRYVAFVSFAQNLVEGDTNGVRDVFVHDAATGRTIRASESSDGIQGDGPSDSPVINSDARYVAFASSARTLEPGDGGQRDLFLRDLATRTTARVRARDALVRLPGPYSPADLSGRFVVSDDARFSPSIGATWGTRTCGSSGTRTSSDRTASSSTWRRYRACSMAAARLVAERATYASANGVPWAAGLALAGTPRQ